MGEAVRLRPDYAEAYNNLGNALSEQSKYGEADPMYRRAIAIWEKAVGQDHPSVATGLNNLAAVCVNMKKYSEAETLLQRSFEISAFRSTAV